MSDDPIVQILVEAYQRGKEIALAKKVNAPSHPQQANPVTPTAKPVRARRKVTAAVKPCAVVLAWVCGFFALAQGDHAAAHRDLQQA